MRRTTDRHASVPLFTKRTISTDGTRSITILASTFCKGDKQLGMAGWAGRFSPLQIAGCVAADRLASLDKELDAARMKQPSSAPRQNSAALPRLHPPQCAAPPARRARRTRCPSQSAPSGPRSPRRCSGPQWRGPRSRLRGAMGGNREGGCAAGWGRLGCAAAAPACVGREPTAQLKATGETRSSHSSHDISRPAALT